ncbi:MAG TPA: sensor histidine kinase, partial [Rudaea sp.]|nr:sensor histidine kinase [Rudaea sp.]
MAGIHYRRRLRSRIIISFTLFGFALAALFACAAIYLRDRLEDQLVNNRLEREVQNFVDFKREHPDPSAQWYIGGYDADIKAAHAFGNVAFDRQKYDTSGVYDIYELGVEGKMRPFKLAVY